MLMLQYLLWKWNMIWICDRIKKENIFSKYYKKNVILWKKYINIFLNVWYRNQVLYTDIRLRRYLWKNVF